VKTGVQAILNGFKILDSGFRRNDGKKMQADFFTASGKGRGTFRMETSQASKKVPGKMMGQGSLKVPWPLY